METCSTSRPVRALDADVIVYSSNNLEHRVHRTILAQASPFFRSLLNTQPPSCPSDSTSEPRVVHLPEDAPTLKALILFCYPVGDPELTTIEEIHAVLDAARKYQMACVFTNIRWSLARLLPTEPRRIYAIAYMFEMADIAQEAAKRLLQDPEYPMPPSCCPPEYSTLPATAICAMHFYRQKCVEVALHDLEDWDWIECGPHDRASVQGRSADWVWLRCSEVHNPARVHKGIYAAHQWFDAYVTSLKAAVKERPSGATVLSHLNSNDACEILNRARYECDICAQKAQADLVHLSKLLAERIDAEIATVKLWLPFADRIKSRDGPAWI